MIAIRASVAFTVALFVCTPSRPENVPIYIYTHEGADVLKNVVRDKKDASMFPCLETNS